jgi:NAD-dependent DNA ligase
MKFETAKAELIDSLLVTASKAYYEGTPILSDPQFDYLADLVNFKGLGAKPTGDVKKHYKRMFSLQKHYAGEGKVPLADYPDFKYTSPKLDGAAISILYINKQLVQVLTRGDGIEGRDITEKFLFSSKSTVPKRIELDGIVQVTGEITTTSDVENARNYASGALNLIDVTEFNSRDIYFTAYSMYPETQTYERDLEVLRLNGFKTVADEDWCAQFDTDGIVVRVNNNEDYNSLGFTAKHPRGAYAVKERKFGAITTLLSVEWQVGKSGKVTPVAILEPCKIGDSTVARATLNNMAFIDALDLEIGCKVEVQKMGDIIPGIIRRIHENDIDFVE